VGKPTLQNNFDAQCETIPVSCLKKQIEGTEYSAPPIPELFYLCAGFSGAGAGVSAGFSGAGAGACSGAGAGAGAGASAGFGVSAGLQPTVKATNNINDKTNAITFFIEFSPPSRIPCVSQR